MNFGNLPTQNQLIAWLLRRTATAGIRRVVSVGAAVATEIGNVRDENQDRAVIARGRDKQGQEYAVLAVADGIGGMREGSTCAAMALGAFLAVLDQHARSGAGDSEEWIRRAVNAANQVVFDRFRGDGGSTLVALVIRSGYPTFWLSVGDSRVYCATGKNLRQVSVDDTIAGQLGKAPEVGFEQSKLIQFIGMGNELEPHIAAFDGEQCDAVILTTDGIHYLAPAPGWLGQIVGNAPDPGVCVKRLADLAKWCGGPDNASVAMITLASVRESDDKPPYFCLEVWDAFGELQIVGNGIPTEEYSTVAQPKVAAPADQAVITPPRRSASATDIHPAKPERGASPPRRGKKTHKAKNSIGKRDKQAAELAEIDPPQLLMEFPNKSN